MKRVAATFLLGLCLVVAPGAEAKSAPSPLTEIEGVTVKDFHVLSRSGLNIWMHRPGTARAIPQSADQLQLIRSLGLSLESAKAETTASPPSLPLPSGRKGYRYWDDYRQEMIRLARDYPSLVRLHNIGETHEGRQIIGLEIARRVWESDGRPSFVQYGLTHSREFPSAELPMEFVYELLQSQEDPRISAILENVRIFTFPVLNVDGFMAARGARPGSPANLSLPGPERAGQGFDHYRRKNCRPSKKDKPGTPCSALQRIWGSVDLNRNFGAFWGGAGASDKINSEIYRGSRPFSEPESRALRGFLSSLQPQVVLAHHTYWKTGLWLRPPGFFDAQLFPNNTSPDEVELASLGSGFEDATGWPSRKSNWLYPATGASDDWSYYNMGSLAYTSEVKGTDFHARFRDMVQGSYPGFAEAVLQAAEKAASSETRVYGEAPPGAKLVLSKNFQSPYCSGSSKKVNCKRPFQYLQEDLRMEITVPESGVYTWHVLPSSRPLHPEETWQISCQGSAPRELSLERGQSLEINWNDCQAPTVEPLEIVDPLQSRPGERHLLVARNAQGDVSWDLDNDGNFSDASGDFAYLLPVSAGDFTVSAKDARGSVSISTRVLPPYPSQASLQIQKWIRPINLSWIPKIGWDDVVFRAKVPRGSRVSWDFDLDGRFDDGRGFVVSRSWYNNLQRPGYHLLQARARVVSAEGNSATKTVRFRVRR